MNLAGEIHESRLIGIAVEGAQVLHYNARQHVPRRALFKTRHVLGPHAFYRNSSRRGVKRSESRIKKSTLKIFNVRSELGAMDEKGPDHCPEGLYRVLRASCIVRMHLKEGLVRREIKGGCLSFPLVLYT